MYSCDELYYVLWNEIYAKVAKHLVFHAFCVRDMYHISSWMCLWLHASWWCTRRKDYSIDDLFLCKVATTPQLPWSYSYTCHHVYHIVAIYIYTMHTPPLHSKHLCGYPWVSWYVMHDLVKGMLRCTCVGVYRYVYIATQHGHHQARPRCVDVENKYMLDNDGYKLNGETAEWISI